MTAQQKMNMRTSGQLVPKPNGMKHNQNPTTPFLIGGCSVSFTSTPKSTDETIKTVKEILLSAYRTKAVRG